MGVGNRHGEWAVDVVDKTVRGNLVKENVASYYLLISRQDGLSVNRICQYFMLESKWVMVV